MSISSHLSQLRKKHQALAEVIEREQRRPSIDGLQLAQLKREKLHIKERIEQLASDR